MELIKAALMGLVEGLTEFLPVSSTGHLILAGHALDYPQRNAETFDIFIQLGAMLAVYWHYRKDLLALVRRAPHESAARNFLLKVAVAFLPAAAVGFLLHHWIEEYLFNPASVAGALIFGGIVLLAVERRLQPASTMDLEQVSWGEALFIGAAQVTSLFPGVSRAGATIVGGLLAGLSRPVATQFSFYLALPTLTAASLYSLLKSLGDLSIADAPELAIGLGVAFVSALIVIRVFLAFVETHDFRPFAYYRIAAGILVYAALR